MKKKYRYMKMIALFLSLVMIVCSTPMTIIAEPVETDSAEQQVSDGMISESMEIVESEKIEGIAEVISLREENAKHFKRTDGTYEMVVYPTAVHRKDENGNWQDIDNNLTLQTVKNASFYATADARTRFAKSFAWNQELFALNEDGYSISMSFVSNSISTGNLQTSVLPLSETRVENAPARSDTKEFSTVKEAAEINNTSSIYYSGINATTDLEYVLNGNSVKENIIVKSKGGNYKYTFDLSLGGLVAVLNENNTVSLIDPKTAEVQYRIPVPYMYDANGARSYDVTYTLQALEAGEYRLVISANADWINAEGRAFPVVVDPVIEEVAGQDTYIDSLAPSYNFGYNDDMIVGSTQIAFIQGEMPEVPDGAEILQAHLVVSYYYDYGVDSGSATLGAYRVLQPWDEMTLKWNTANQYTNLGISTTLLDSQTLNGSTGATNDEPEWAWFTITDAVDSWYDGTASNYGIALRYISGTHESVYLHTYDAYPEYSAYYRVAYSYYVPNGVYALKNVGNSGLWMDTQNDSSEAGKHIQQYAYSTAPTASFSRGGLFKISRLPSSDQYVIRLMTNNNLTFGIVGTEILTHQIPPDDADVADIHTFYIDYSDGGFLIRPYANPTYVITANQTTASGAAGAPNSYLTKVLQTNATSSAKWTLHQYTGVQKSGATLYYSETWRDKGIQLNWPYTVSGAIDYTTHINAHEHIIGVADEDEELVNSEWNATTKQLSVTAINPGELTLLVKLLYASNNTEAASVAFVYRIIPDEATYYIQNVGTERYIDIEGPSQSSGAYVQQWDFHTGAYERWTVEHVEDSDGYIRLKSPYSNLYMGVDSSNTSLIKQYATQNNYTLWTIDRSATGNLIFICKATQANGVVLSVPLNSNINGTDLTQFAYTEDTNYRDEWNMHDVADYLGQIAHWNSDSSRIAYWNSIPTIFSEKMISDSNFYYEEGYASAILQWSDALGISFSTAAESTAKIACYGLTPDQYKYENPRNSEELDWGNGDAGLTISTRTTIGYVVCNNEVKTVQRQVLAVVYIIHRPQNAPKSEAAIKQVTTHEMGHALGHVGHSPTPTDVMYAYTHESYLLKNSEINHLRQIYDLMY